MKLLADEGVDSQVVSLLRKEGRDVRYVAELDPGISDENVLGIANGERRKLLTTDKDLDHAEDLSSETFAVITPGTIRIRNPPDVSGSAPATSNLGEYR